MKISTILYGVGVGLFFGVSTLVHNVYGLRDLAMLIGILGLVVIFWAWRADGRKAFKEARSEREDSWRGGY